MLDFADEMLDWLKPLVVGILRFLWWLIWEMCCCTIPWTVGWFEIKLITFGNYPKCPLNGYEYVSVWVVGSIQIVGLSSIAICLWWLTKCWPAW